MVDEKIWTSKTCTLPADTTGYDVTGCNVGGHAWDTALTESEVV